MSDPLPKASALAEAWGAAIEAARVRLNLTPEAVGQRAGMSAAEVRLIEMGACEPTLTQAVHLAVALGASPSWLMEETLSLSDLIDPDPQRPWARRLRLRRVILGCAAQRVFQFSASAEPRRAEQIGDQLEEELARWGLAVVGLPSARGRRRANTNPLN